MDNTIDKVWGISTKVWASNNAEVHSIEINKGGFCSKHLHEAKSNLFFVNKGKLMVEVWEEDNNSSREICIRKFILTPQESLLVVSPKVYHRFTALEDTLATEIYWTEDINPYDIVRQELGGVKKI